MRRRWPADRVEGAIIAAYLVVFVILVAFGVYAALTGEAPFVDPGYRSP